MAHLNSAKQLQRCSQAYSCPEGVTSAKEEPVTARLDCNSTPKYQHQLHNPKQWLGQRYGGNASTGVVYLDNDPYVHRPLVNVEDSLLNWCLILYFFLVEPVFLY